MSEHFLLSKLKSSSSDIKELAKTICIKQIKQFFEEIKTARKISASAFLLTDDRSGLLSNKKSLEAKYVPKLFLFF